MRKVIALKDGFYGGNRIREGQKFSVSDTAKGKWFVDEAGFKEPEPLPNFENGRQGVKAHSQSFINLMKQAPVPEPEPETLSGMAKRRGPSKHEDAFLGKK